MIFPSNRKKGAGNSFFPARNQANIVFSFATKGHSNSQGNQYVCIWSQEHWAQKRQWSGPWITGVMSREHRDCPLHLAWGETHSLADQLFRQTEWGGSVGILFRASKKDFDLQRRKMMICLILFNIWTMPCSGKLAVVPHKSLALWEGRAEHQFDNGSDELIHWYTHPPWTQQQFWIVTLWFLSGTHKPIFIHSIRHSPVTLTMELCFYPLVLGATKRPIIRVLMVEGRYRHCGIVIYWQCEALCHSGWIHLSCEI